MATGLSPSTAGLSRPLRLHGLGVSPSPGNATSPSTLRRGIWFGLSPFRSPLLRGSLLVSLPPPTKMFPFGGSPLGTRNPINVGCFPERHRLLTRGRRSHSGIPGSTAACAYPGHIAACRALRRRPSRAIHQAASVPLLSPRATGSA